MEAALVLLLQLYLKDLGASPLIISLSGSLAWAGTLFASPVWGAWSDRFSSRRLVGIIFIGSVAATAPLAGLLVAPAVLVLGTLRRFLANGLAPIGMRLISASSTHRNRGRNLSYLSAARAAGFVFGGILAGVWLERMGFRWTFILVAALPLCVLPFVSRLPRRSEASRGRASFRSLRGLGAIWTPQLTLLYAAITLRQLATTGVGALAYVYMSSFSIGSEMMGVIGAVNPAVAVLATLGVGMIVDRINRKAVISLGFAVAVLYPLGYAWATTPWMFALAAMPLGLSFGAYYSGSTAQIGRTIPFEHQGTMFGLLDSFRGLGGLLGPILAGVLVTAYGYRPMFLIMAALSALALLLSIAGTRAS